MARMNPKRRARAAQAKLFREIVDGHGKAHDDSALLQRGAVRSSYTRLETQAPQNVRSIAYRMNARPDGFAPGQVRVGANLKAQKAVKPLGVSSSVKSKPALERKPATGNKSWLPC